MPLKTENQRFSDVFKDGGGGGGGGGQKIGKKRVMNENGCICIG